MKVSKDLMLEKKWLPLSVYVHSVNKIPVRS